MKLSQKPIYTDTPVIPEGSYVPVSIPTPFGNRIFRCTPDTVGAQGVQGVQGPIGPAGPAGTNGVNGADGADGSVWHNGAGAPGGGLGVNGDYYLDTTSGDVYEKAAGVWGVVGNIKGPTGAAGADGADGAAWSPTHSTLTYAATVTPDFTGDDYKTVTLTGDIDFTASSNRAAGRSVVIRVVGDGSQRTLAFNASWTFLGTKPATLAANKDAVLSLTAFGANESDVVACWGVEA